jgi:hypothetical protein
VFSAIKGSGQKGEALETACHEGFFVVLWFCGFVVFCVCVCVCVLFGAFSRFSKSDQNFGFDWFNLTLRWQFRILRTADSMIALSLPSLPLSLSP